MKNLSLIPFVFFCPFPISFIDTTIDGRGMIKMLMYSQVITATTNEIIYRRISYTVSIKSNCTLKKISTLIYYRYLYLKIFSLSVKEKKKKTKKNYQQFKTFPNFFVYSP